MIDHKNKIIFIHLEKAGGTIAPVEVKPTKEKFLKTTKKTDKRNSQTKEDSAE